MKDNPQLSNITEVIEPTEEAQDLVTLTNSVSSSSFFGIEEELDPITQAIRQEILQKQLHILKDYIAANLDVTVNYHDDQKFAEYLKNVNNRAIINQAFLNSKVKAELEKIEIAGYKHQTKCSALCNNINKLLLVVYQPHCIVFTAVLC